MIDLVKQFNSDFSINTIKVCEDLKIKHTRLIDTLEHLCSDFPNLKTRLKPHTTSMNNTYNSYDLTPLTHAMLLSRLRSEEGKSLYLSLMAKLLEN